MEQNNDLYFERQNDKKTVDAGKNPSAPSAHAPPPPSVPARKLAESQCPVNRLVADVKDEQSGIPKLRRDTVMSSTLLPGDIVQVGEGGSCGGEEGEEGEGVGRKRGRRWTVWGMKQHTAFAYNHVRV